MERSPEKREGHVTASVLLGGCLLECFIAADALACPPRAQLINFKSLYLAQRTMASSLQPSLHVQHRSYRQRSKQRSLSNNHDAIT